MLASEKLIAKLNEQVGNELEASHQYLCISAHFDRENLPELSRFFLRQAEEEREHALKFVTFINDVEGLLQIPQIPAPRAEYSSAAEAVGLALEWEQTVTEQIYNLVEIAKEGNNLIAQRFLDWFITEQLEEVNTMSTLLGIIERAGEDRLLHVEDYLARESGKLGAETE